MSYQMDVVFSGAKLREFLLRSGMTYKEAAERIGVDKNTIGKAVRGGSINVALLLKICNSFHIPVEWFFSTEKATDDYGSDELLDASEVCEQDEEYQSAYNNPPVDHECINWQIIHSKEEEIILLSQLVENYKAQVKLLQRRVEELTRNKQ